MISKNVNVLLKSELQMITLENDALMLEKEQLTSQLNDQTKLFEPKSKKYSNCVMSSKPMKVKKCMRCVLWQSPMH